MSRSRKKTPVHGMTCASSDKLWKRESHKRLRAHETRLKRRMEYEEDIPEERALTSVWSSPKDGKTYNPSWAKSWRK